MAGRLIAIRFVDDRTMGNPKGSTMIVLMANSRAGGAGATSSAA